MKKGTIVRMGVRFEKLDDRNPGLWVSLDSNYPVVVGMDKFNSPIYENRPETDKPLYKEDGSLNRYGFKWTDEQVKKYFNEKC